jgi:hypothetical protein
VIVWQNYCHACNANLIFDHEWKLEMEMEVRVEVGLVWWIVSLRISRGSKRDDGVHPVGWHSFVSGSSAMDFREGCRR